jgi:two-component system, NtrC family, response regulator HupR/HoxA
VSASFDPRAYPILIVDDEPDILEIFELNYGRQFTVRAAGSGRAALEIVAAEPIAVLVADQRMPGMSGLELIRRAREIRPDLLPIILTGYTDPGALVDAINLGCIRRYIPKPFEPKELGDALAQAVEAYHLTRRNVELSAENARLVAELSRVNERLAQENRYLKQRAEGGGFDAIVGRSPAIRGVIERARRVLDTPTTVLLEGATGTGKELVARAIHYEGARRGKLFVAVNTGSVSESLLASTLFGHRRGAFTGAVGDQKGLFEIADGGTLFLDEIGETTPSFQVHLLRALQEGEVLPVGATRPVRVDVRVIAATNRNLEEDVRRGRFREDLLHRLRVFPIRCPSLAERRDDIPLLAEHVLAKLAARLGKAATGFTPEALAALACHTYAGNVRELENLIERALLLCPAGEPISSDDLFERLPAAPVGAPSAPETLQDAVSRFERERIREALAECGGNKTQAARRLGLTYRGFLMKLHRYGMVNGGAERVA